VILIAQTINKKLGTITRKTLMSLNKWAAPKRLGPLGGSEKRGVFVARFVMYFKAGILMYPLHLFGVSKVSWQQLCKQVSHSTAAAVLEHCSCCCPW
jgi:hypothetical protein